MTDDQKPIIPNAVSPGEAVHDLTADLKRGEKTSDGRRVGWNYRGHNTLVKGTLTENGETVVTYTLNAPQASGAFNARDFPNIRPLDGEKERAAVRRIFDEMETVARLKFVELPAADAEKADIRFFRHGKMNAGGSSFESADENGRIFRDVVMSQNETANESILRHEILHMLGLSHPGKAKAAATEAPDQAGGGDRRYTTELTAMSYNSPGAVYVPWLGRKLAVGGTQWELGAADVETLKELYGAREETDSKTFTAETLRNKQYLNAHLPTALEIGAGHKGELNIETSGDPYERFGKISGELSDTDGKKPARIAAFLTSSTAIRDVRVDPDAKVAVNVTGNREQNRLQGGALDDTFTPRGGGDVMTGGKGGDTFVLDGKGGFDNVITDWEADRDVITLKSPIAGAVLHARKDHPIAGGRHDGSELVAKDAAGKPVASLFIIGATPEQVADRVRGTEKDDKIPVAIQPEDASPADAEVRSPATPTATQPAKANAPNK